MVAKEDLEKKVDRLRDRIQKAGEDAERPLPPDAVRRFRKRLKRTQRKLTAIAAKEEKLAKSIPAEKKPTEARAAEEKAPEAQASEKTTAEKKAPENRS